MNYEKKYKVECDEVEMNEVSMTDFEVNNLGAIHAFNICGSRYLIKSIYGYIGKYAVVIISSNRKYRVLYNSDSVKFLITALEAKHCRLLKRSPSIGKQFISGNYNKHEWLPELNSKSWLAERQRQRIERQRNSFQ